STVSKYELATENGSFAIVRRETSAIDTGRRLILWFSRHRQMAHASGTCVVAAPIRRRIPRAACASLMSHNVEFGEHDHVAVAPPRILLTWLAILVVKRKCW